MILSFEYEVHVRFGSNGQLVHEIVGKMTVSGDDSLHQVAISVPVQPGFRRETTKYTTDLMGRTCQFVFTDEQVQGPGPDNRTQQPIIVG